MRLPRITALIGACLAILLTGLCAGCGPKVSGSSDDDAGDDTDAGCLPQNECGQECCTDTQYCYNSRCLQVVGECDIDPVCPEDARCIDGHCIPWSEFPAIDYDTGCVRDVEPGVLRPQLQCAWESDPNVDPNAAFYAIRHTPLVVDFQLGDVDLSRGPSIVVVGRVEYRGGDPGCPSRGPVVILDGRTCEALYTTDATADGVRVTVTPAAADLDGDGVAEVIAPGSDGGLRAFTYDRNNDEFVLFWRSTDQNGNPSTLGVNDCQWGGVTVADLDGGFPEIFFEGAAHGPDGQIIATIADWQHFAHGNPMVVLDVDLDGEPEVVEGYGTYDYVQGVGFQRIAGWVGTGGSGFIAVADFGDFAGAAGDAPGRPEVVVVSNDVRLQTVLGEVVFTGTGGSGHGGPPTIADFDGDGRPEIGVAFGDGYVVYDLDCVGTPAGCEGDGILWSQPSQDLSSARTGSSLFDFNGDGLAEVVYGDECFVRVYDGLTGEVKFSQGRFSSTWQENVVIADVDGDASAEIVLPASSTCNSTICAEWDDSFPGIPCDTEDDCPGGPCDTGFCRCTSNAECGDSFECTTPLPATPGTGDVCRTRHVGCLPGIRVYRDARDRWAGSRKIWNQHAYYVTNVEENGEVLPFDQVLYNWQETGLNNFRQNVQGVVGPMPSPDLTVRDVGAAACNGTTITLEATVCNRGAAGTDAGVLVTFIDTQAGNTVLCEAITTGFLDPGQCETVTCDAQMDPGTTVQALVNENDAVGECLPDNNASLPAAAVCPN